MWEGHFEGGGGGKGKRERGVHFERKVHLFIETRTGRGFGGIEKKGHSTWQVSYKKRENAAAWKSQNKICHSNVSGFF